MKAKKRKLYLDVVKQALRYWDPIRLKEILGEAYSEVDDEYDSYASGILVYLMKKEANVYGISKRLAQIIKNSMGLSDDARSEREEEIAQKLIDWKESGHTETPHFDLRTDT